MCSFITQHNVTDVRSFGGACSWHADCRNVHQSCWLWIECPFHYHKPSPIYFPRIWQYIQPASPPQTTCDRLRPATRTADATVGLHKQRISAQTVRNCLREAHLRARRPHQGLDLTAAHAAGQLIFMDQSRFSLYRADGRQHVWRCVGEQFANVGYGMGRHKLWTMNTGAFYW